jgi:glycosyltransferase involved in cell wall biosynthesis
MPERFSDLISVVTPTYNRAHTLRMLFDSIVRQQDQNIEWVLIDDGSTDETPVLVEEMQAEGTVSIRYFRQPNAGRCAALNRGYTEAAGTFIWGMDSDDWIPNDAVAKFRDIWSMVPTEQRETCAGVTGLGIDSKGNLIGNDFPRSPMYARPLELLAKFKVKGDKKEVIRAELLKGDPFPIFEGEKLVATSLVLFRLGKQYTFCCANIPFVVKVYLQDGLTKNLDSTRMRSPKAARQLYLERFVETRFFAPAFRFRTATNYIRFGLHASVPIGRQMRDVGYRLTAWLALPVGAFFFLRDRRRFGSRPEEGAPPVGSF